MSLVLFTFPFFFLGSPVLMGFFDIPIVILGLIAIFYIPQDQLLIKKISLLKHELLVLLGLIILLFIYASLSSLYNAGEVSSYLSRPIRLGLILLLLTVLTPYLKLESLFKGVLLFSTFNLFVVFFQVYSGHVGLDTLPLNFGGFDESRDTPYRKPGIFNSFILAGFFCVIGMLLSVYFYSKNKHLFLYLILILLFFVGAILTSRTALFVMIFFIFFIIPFSCIFEFKKNKHIFEILLIMVISILGLTVSFFVYFEDNRLFQGVINKAFALFINFFEGRGFIDYSSRDLVENHYKFPTTISEFFVGNSKMPFSGGVNSDVSFVRILFTVGMPSLILYLILFGFVFFRVTKIYLKTRSLEALLVLWFLIVTFIFLFKGPYMFSRTIAEFIFLVWLPLLYAYRSSKL